MPLLLRSLTIMLLLLATHENAGAQQTTTPGGIPKTATTMRVWLDAQDVNADNNGTAAPANDTELSFWKDKSGNFINFSQAITASKPRYIANMGGFPSIYFNDVVGGSKHTLNPVIPQNNLQNGTVFFVYQGKKITGQASNVLMEDKRNSGDGSLRYAQYPNTDTIGFTLYNIADYKSKMRSPYDETVVMSFSKATSNASVEIRAKDQSGSVNIGSSTRMIPIGSLGTNTNTPADYTNGYFFEMAIYDNYLNTAQVKIIENHLAAKYSGTTSSLLPVPAIIYSGANAGNGNYDYDVIGVGKESAGSSLQADNSFGFSLTASNGGANGSYLVIGHNDGARTSGKGWINTNITGQVGLQQQFDRVWYFDRTGTPAMQSITFDFVKAKSTIVPEGDACKYVLMYRTGQTGSWTILQTASAVNGTVLTFNTPSITLDGYYTIGQIENVFNNNTISASQTINCGSNPAQLTGTVPTGSVTFSYQWQQSLDGTTNWTTAAGTANGQNYTAPAIGINTWYRRVVSNGVCSNISNVIQVTVNSVNSGNVIKLATPGNTTICYNTSAGQLLTNSGTLGSTYTYQWQQQVTGSAAWTNISGATTESYTTPALTTGTSFRRVTTTTGTPNCSHISNVIAVAVNPYVEQQGPIQGPDSVCQAETNVVYQIANTAGATYIWNYSGSGATITAGATSSSITITYAANATSGNWTVTMTQNGCNSIASLPYAVFVKPSPVVNTVSDKTLCNGAPTGAIDFTASVSPATFSWTNNKTSIGLGASGTGNISTFNGINTGTADSTATITITATAKGCSSAAKTFAIIVHPKPQGSLSSNITICEGQPVQLSFNRSAGTGPFQLTINGSTYNGVQSGVPFTIPTPTQTTIYTLSAIKDSFNCVNP